MDKINEELGRVLASYRKQNHMRGQDVADILGVTKTAIHYWESGKRTIDAVTLIRYCEAIGVAPSVVINEVIKNACL